MIKEYNVNYSPQAIGDLRNIYLYIKEELMVSDVARGQVERIRVNAYKKFSKYKRNTPHIM